MQRRGRRGWVKKSKVYISFTHSGSQVRKLTSPPTTAVLGQAAAASCWAYGVTSAPNSGAPWRVFRAFFFFSSFFWTKSHVAQANYEAPDDPALLTFLPPFPK